MSFAEPLDRHRPVADLRLLVPAMVAWAVCWWSTGQSPRSSAIACAAGIVVAAVTAAVGVRVLAAAALAVAAAAAAAGLHMAVLRAGPLPSLARDQSVVSLAVTVSTDPVVHASRAVGSQLRPDLVILRGTVTALVQPRAVSGMHSPVLLLVSADAGQWTGLSPSQRLLVSGKLAPPLPADDISAVLSVRGPPRLIGRPSAVQRAASVVRTGLRLAVAGHSPDVAGLLPGLVLGDVSHMDPQLTDDFRTAGLTHLVAVSGANVAIVFAVVLAMARVLRVPPRTSLLLAGVVLVGFVVLVRPTPSVVRAAMMAALLVLASLTGRLRQPFSALLAAVLVLMLVDPELSRSAGFALSTAATAALLVLAPRWASVLRRRMPARIADPLAVALAAQLACGPLIAVLSGQVSLVSVPANMVAEPAVPFATIFGVLSAVTAPVSMTVARWLADVAAVPTWWLATVARRSAGLPHATMAWRQSAWGGVLLAVLTVVLLVALRRRWWRRAMAAASTGALGVLVVGQVLAGPWASSAWEFVACDVGQGDGLVLNAGAGTAVVVDAGPDPAKMQACLDGLRIRHVALVVFSHLHADHVEGLPGVLHGRRVDAIDVGPLAEPPGEWVRVQRWAADAGVPIGHLNAGDSFATGDITAAVIAPQVVLHHTDSDPNNDSLVLRVAMPSVSLLLTGDVERPAQQALLSGGARLDADVVKVPHHGSANQDLALLRATGAIAAVTSVGLGNTYGHPAPVTMAAVSTDGMRGYRTDHDGAVEVDLRSGHIAVTGHHGDGTAPASQRNAADASDAADAASAADAPDAAGAADTSAARRAAGGTMNAAQTRAAGAARGATVASGTVGARRLRHLQPAYGLTLVARTVSTAGGRRAPTTDPLTHGMLRTWHVQATRSLRPPSCSVTRSCSSPARSPPPLPPCGRLTPTRT